MTTQSNDRGDIQNEEIRIHKLRRTALLLNVKQLADLLGVSDSSVYELIQEDDFPSLRIGKRIVIPKEELRKWISAHTKGVR